MKEHEHPYWQSKGIKPHHKKLDVTVTHPLKNYEKRQDQLYDLAHKHDLGAGPDYSEAGGSTRQHGWYEVPKDKAHKFAAEATKRKYNVSLSEPPED